MKHFSDKILLQIPMTSDILLTLFSEFSSAILKIRFSVLNIDTSSLPKF